MARKKAGALAAPFQGRWRVVEMDEWDEEARDLVEPAFIRFDGEDGGSPIAEFSWEGVDEGDQRSGRGWVEVGTAGRLVGHFFFHNGDDSGFVCEPW